MSFQIVKYITESKDVVQLFAIDQMKHFAHAEYQTEFDAYKVKILFHNMMNMFDDLGYRMWLKEDAYYKILAYHVTSELFAKLYCGSKTPMYALSIQKTDDHKRFLNGAVLTVKFEDTHELGIDYEFDSWMLIYDNGAF